MQVNIFVSLISLTLNISTFFIECPFPFNNSTVSNGSPLLYSLQRHFYKRPKLHILNVTRRRQIHNAIYGFKMSSRPKFWLKFISQISTYLLFFKEQIPPLTPPKLYVIYSGNIQSTLGRYLCITFIFHWKQEASTKINMWIPIKSQFVYRS